MDCSGPWAGLLWTVDRSQGVSRMEPLSKALLWKEDFLEVSIIINLVRIENHQEVLC